MPKPKAKPSPSATPKPAAAKRRGPDPTGRLDILAIRLLEVGVSLYGDLALRGIYGTYKGDIDRTIRRKLGKIKFYFPPGGELKLGMANQPPATGGPHAR